MKEYIERAQLLKNLGYDETRRADVLPGSTFDIVLKEPAADVAEVWHGRWIKHEGYDECSECHAKSIFGYNYCHNCGASMTDEAVEMELERMEALNND